ncbi:MAG: N-glycosylase/DNA lyase [Candidatus Omnitrophica bacterium]|nr:N-glycosylase/DNA lyase [Candidatus Omnitrophota bacterium]
MKPAKELISAYKKLKPEIKKRLAEFSAIHRSSDEKIFSEMCYCILTANANALKCNEAINELEKKGFILKGEPRHIRPVIKGKARFHNKKAEYIVEARKLFERGGRIDIKSRLDPRDILNVREWLVGNIKGFGYKEASHFLRNIGLGKDIAILDRHILKNLQKYGVIEKIPPSLGSRRIYLEIEKKMKGFSIRTGIPLEDMDLLFWSLQTGFVFK